MEILITVDVDQDAIYEWLLRNGMTDEDLFDDPAILLDYLDDDIAPYVTKIESR